MSKMTDKNIKFALRKNRIQSAIQRKKNRDTADWNKNLHRHQISVDDMIDSINQMEPTKALGFKRILGGIISV